MTTDNQQIEWLEEEVKELSNNGNEGKKERLPALKMEEKTIYEIEVDFSRPFEKWVDQATNTTKKIIPITHKGQKMVFFLNVANPLYVDLIKEGKNGQTKFKIFRIGQAKSTRYDIIKD